MKRTEEVNDALRRLWVILANKAAEHAVAHVDDLEHNSAEAEMAWVAKWLDKAGARATRWYFKVPS